MASCYKFLLNVLYQIDMSTSMDLTVVGHMDYRGKHMSTLHTNKSF